MSLDTSPAGQVAEDGSVFTPAFARGAMVLGALLAFLAMVGVVEIVQQSRVSGLLRTVHLGAIYAERINALVYATEMEVQSLLGATEPGGVQRAVSGIRRSSDEIAQVMRDWQQSIDPEDAVRFAGFYARIETFRALRDELAHRAVSGGIEAARVLGDHDVTRHARAALNEDLAVQARLYAARDGELDGLTRKSLLAAWLTTLTAVASLALMVAGWVTIQRKAAADAAPADGAASAASGAGAALGGAPSENRASDAKHLSLTEYDIAMSVAAAVEVDVPHWSELAQEHEAMQEELRRQRLHLQAALDNMPQGLLMVDESMHLVLCNEHYLQLYRLSRGQAEPGLRVDALLRRQAKCGTFNGDTDAFMRWLGETYPTTGELTLDDGRVIRIVNQPLESGGCVSIHEEITDQRRAEGALARTEQFLATVIEAVPQAVIVKDAQHLRYVLVNRAAEQLFGVSRSLMIGRTARDVFPKESAALLEADDRRMLQARKAVESQGVDIETPANGRRRVTARRLPVYGASGEPSFILSVIDDRTSKDLPAPPRQAA